MQNDVPVPPQYPIESVDNALKLLLLMRERTELRLTEVAKYLGVASSTAHRLLAMLQYRGFLRQNPDTKAYEAGSSLSGIAFAVLNRMDIRAIARPILEELSAELRETVHLGMLEGSVVRYIEAVEGKQPVRVASRIGLSQPVYATSIGKAILAGLPDDVVERLLPQETLEPVTDRTIRTRTQLMADLEVVRQEGYAVNREESEEGVVSLAMAIPELTQKRLALSVAAPVGRIPDTGIVVSALANAVRTFSTAAY